MQDYKDYIESKFIEAKPCGFTVKKLSKHLKPFQAATVNWALRRGRAAICADCGMGKTIMQLEWAAKVVKQSGGDVLIVCPLAVATQTVRESVKFDMPTVNVCRGNDDVKPGINITNYEMLKHFDCTRFAGVVLDESSILKAFMGKTKQFIIDAFSATPYRLACTATPAPNDHLELGNHAQFLGVMDSNEMISRWFINDTMKAGSYRLKGHAAEDFWRWVSSWMVSITKPSDIGFDDTGYILPPLNIINYSVEVDAVNGATDTLFRDGDLSATNLHKEMRMTSLDRAECAAEIVRKITDEPVIVWCNTNYEADDLIKHLPDAVEIRGSEKPETKISKLDAFSTGKSRIIITKPSIAGHGMNWQHCRNVVFVGVSYSYEEFYQAVRRTWRFGQTEEVNCHVISATTEGNVRKVIQEKQEEHRKMQEAMSMAIRKHGLDSADNGDRKLKTDVTSNRISTNLWTAIQGDCVEECSKLADDSIDYCIHSPPFSNLYIYSDSVRDMGNCDDDEDFMRHYSFLIKELYRVMTPGRLVSVHCKDLPLYKGRDGSAGLRDFPGRIIREYESHGFTFHSRVTIWKDPVIEMQRTKNHGLLYKQLCKDSAASRQGMADYLITFRKWVDGLDEFPSPVNAGKPGDERFKRYVGTKGPHMKQEDEPRGYSIEVWQRYASPVWFDINQTNVLNYELARGDQDEKHICPLQLDVIERAVELWTNPNDIVLSPFMGIGSEGYVSVKMGRGFIGTELKSEYWYHACKNLERAERELELENNNLFAKVEA